MLPFSTYAYIREAKGSAEGNMIFSDEILICTLGRSLALYISWAWIGYQYFRSHFDHHPSPVGLNLSSVEGEGVGGETLPTSIPQLLSQIPTSSFPTISSTLELALGLPLEQDEELTKTPETISTISLMNTETVTFSFGSLMENSGNNSPSISSLSFASCIEDSNIINLQNMKRASTIDIKKSLVTPSEPSSVFRFRHFNSIRPIIRHDTISEIDFATTSIDFATFQRKKETILRRADNAFEDTRAMERIIEDAEKLFEATRFVLHSLSDDQYNQLWPELSNFRKTITMWKSPHSEEAARISVEIISCMH